MSDNVNENNASTNNANDDLNANNIPNNNNANNNDANDNDANNVPNNNDHANNNIDANEPVYLVVRNAEEQYSIWPAGRDVPAGWESDGTAGPKEVCLEHIAQVWTDMRPLSLRRRMDLSHA